MLRIWRCDCALSSLETSFHAANHTIPPPPSYEGLPRCPKDKNHSPFHGEKPSHSTQPFNTAIQPNHSTQPFHIHIFLIIAKYNRP